MYERAIFILDAVLITAAVLSAGTWVYLLRTRVAKRLPIVAPLDRPQPFWNMAEFFVAFGLPIICGLAGVRVGMQWMTPEAQEMLESGKVEGSFTAPQDQFVLMVINFVAMSLTLLSVLVWMGLMSKRLLTIYGFWPSLDDVKRGLWASFLVLPGLLLLNHLIGQLIKYEHPVIEMFNAETSLTLLCFQALVTVIMAPLYEEFTFRACLQGGLEQVMRRMNVATLSSPDEPSPEQATELSTITAAEVSGSSWWPVVISSGIFAMLHLPHGGGAAPILVLALVLGYLYRQTGRLWPGLIVHMMLNGISVLTLFMKVLLSPA